MNGLCKNMAVKETVIRKDYKFDEPEFEFVIPCRSESYKNKLQLNDVPDESELLRRRIKRREEEEEKRERELILTGKLKATKSYIKTDKVLQIQEKMQEI